MAIEIEDLPIKNGDFPVRYVSLPGNIWGWSYPYQPMPSGHFCYMASGIEALNKSPKKPSGHCGHFEVT